MQTAIQLTLFEYQEMPLVELEAIVDRGMATFIEVGLALLAIREGKKYRDAGYTDFNVYIEERWGMGKSYGSYLLNAGYIGNEISTMVDNKPKPTHERQVRPLSRLGTLERPRDDWPQPASWVKAWEEACDLAGKGQPPTTKDVEYVVKKMMWVDPPPIPPGKYRVIYADPPWAYGDTMGGFSKNLPGYDVSAEMHYPSMTIDQLCALPVCELADVNAVLFLWVTVPLMQDVFELIEAWGFEYKTNFVWDKIKHNFGHYNSVRHELLFVCTRGSCLPDNPKLFDSVVSIERTEHSHKPEQFREMIDTLYPDGARIELFSRKKVEGWEAWGNEPNIS
jgi:N6-adenosine-specific RNA methylase IME4